jgi:NAD-dependent deacetylase
MQGETRETQFERAAELWNASRFPIAFTGAGISVASGIPDFRSPGGLWSKYDPMKVATAEAIQSNPRAVWEFLLDTADLLQSCQPNAAHLALATLEEHHGLRGIITQNVDNLHQRAGSREVVEFHGNFERFYCQKCGEEEARDKVQDKARQVIPPMCDQCESFLRPDVVFFGEAIPVPAMQRSQELIRMADLILITGTSGEVAPANTIPREVKMKGGRVIEINKGMTYFRDIADIRFDGPVEQILPQILEHLSQ